LSWVFCCYSSELARLAGAARPLIDHVSGGHSDPELEPHMDDTYKSTEQSELAALDATFDGGHAAPEPDLDLDAEHTEVAALDAEYEGSLAEVAFPDSPPASLAETAPRLRPVWEMEDEDTEEMMKLAWVFYPHKHCWPDSYGRRILASKAFELGGLRTRPLGWDDYTPRWVKLETYKGLAQWVNPLVTAESGSGPWSHIKRQLEAAGSTMSNVQAFINQIICNVQPANPLPREIDTAWMDWIGVEEEVLKIYSALDYMVEIIRDLFISTGKSKVQIAVDRAFREVRYQRRFTNHKLNAFTSYNIFTTPKGVMDRIRRRLMNFPIRLFRELMTRGVDHENRVMLPDPSNPEELKSVFQVKLESVLALCQSIPLVEFPTKDEALAMGWTALGRKKAWGHLGADWSPEALLDHLRRKFKVGPYEPLADVPENDPIGG